MAYLLIWVRLVSATLGMTMALRPAGVSVAIVRRFFRLPVFSSGLSVAPPFLLGGVMTLFRIGAMGMG